MIQLLDRTFNLLLNAAGFSGLNDPHQILIAVVIGTATVLWNSTLVPRWALMSFFTLMGMAAFVALYALLFGLRSTCIYVYDEGRPVCCRRLGGVGASRLKLARPTGKAQ
jgi:hypothetical protein